LVEPLVRRAKPEDVDFLVEAAIEADRSGGARSSYASLFDLSPDETRSILKEALLLDVPGQELNVSGALVVELNGNLVASTTGWVEGEDETLSMLAKAALLFSVLGPQRTQAARPRLALLGALTIPRLEGAIQLESIYVRQEGRGRGFLALLVSAHIAELGGRSTSGRAQILLAGNNQRALHAYHKLGFQVTTRRHSDEPKLRELLADDTRILMERSL